jgi:hypothetical protein
MNQTLINQGVFAPDLAVTVHDKTLYMHLNLKNTMQGSWYF